jgi:hypothetical protein
MFPRRQPSRRGGLTRVPLTVDFLLPGAIVFFARRVEPLPVLPGRQTNPMHTKRLVLATFLGLAGCSGGGDAGVGGGGLGPVERCVEGPCP